MSASTPNPTYFRRHACFTSHSNIFLPFFFTTHQAEIGETLLMVTVHNGKWPQWWYSFSLCLFVAFYSILSLTLFHSFTPYGKFFKILTSLLCHSFTFSVSPSVFVKSFILSLHTHSIFTFSFLSFLSISFFPSISTTHSFPFSLFINFLFSRSFIQACTFSLLILDHLNFSF